MSEELPTVVEITRVVEETPSVRTFYFDHRFSFIPGQFVMVWVPGVDEVPMALSSGDAITVQRVGDATGALFKMRAGSRLGIRGPFGTGFPRDGGVLAVAGGVGAAPLMPLVREGLVKTFLLGSRTSCELPFAREIPEYTNLHVSTDDGSQGYHGSVVDLMAKYRLREYKRICTCGPEPMMAAIWKLLENAGITDRGAFSLHRYMKCGIGVCGSCCIDPSGGRVCREGPVFSGDSLRDSEFGHYRRGPSGERDIVWDRQP
ncbi:MAG: dihydroorotate dehydrogenase electron transfer subunit [Methanoregulaceae archaeon]|nr:dihydroorotate dehydrogenase electron transfer subunit [Methanoregulaceae archaeon]